MHEFGFFGQIVFELEKQIMDFISNLASEHLPDFSYGRGFIFLFLFSAYGSIIDKGVIYLSSKRFHYVMEKCKSEDFLIIQAKPELFIYDKAA